MSVGRDIEGCAFYLQALSPEASSYRGFCGERLELPNLDNYEVVGSRVPLKELTAPIPFGYKQLAPLFGVESYEDGDLLVTVMPHPVEYWTVAVAVERELMLATAIPSHYPAFIEGDRFFLHLNYNPLPSGTMKHLKEKMNV